MKHLSILLLLFSVLCNSLLAVEYGFLTSKSGENYNNYVILEEGDLLEITTTYSTSTQNWHSVIGYEIGVDLNLLQPNIYQNLAALSNYTLYRLYLPWGGDDSAYKLVGPMVVCLAFTNNNSFSGHLASLSYTLTRASEQVLTSNTITIPAINGQDWAVTLEQSTDLANWSAVAPGTVTGTESLQFYRIRVTDNANGGN